MLYTEGPVVFQFRLFSIKFSLCRIVFTVYPLSAARGKVSDFAGINFLDLRSDIQGGKPYKLEVFLLDVRHRRQEPVCVGNRVVGRFPLHAQLGTHLEHPVEKDCAHVRGNQGLQAGEVVGVRGVGVFFVLDVFKEIWIFWVPNWVEGVCVSDRSSWHSRSISLGTSKLEISYFDLWENALVGLG